MNKELWQKLSSRVSGAPAPAAEEPKVEEPRTENSVQEMNGVSEAAPAAAPAASEASETPTVEEPKPFDKSEFFNFLNSLAEQPAEPSQPAITPPIAQAQPAVPALTPTASDDFDEAELAAILTEEGLNPKQLRSVLNKVESRAYSRATTDLTRDLYPVMQQVAVNVAAWSSAATRFRAKNEDLEPAMQFVAQQSNKIASAHPDWSPDKVYDEAGKVTRKAIEYFMQQQQGEQKPKKPAFAPTPGGKAPAAKAKSEDPNRAFMRNLLKWNEPQSTRV